MFHSPCRRKSADANALQATILHLPGLDHERLTYRYAGRDFRLIDIHGKSVQGLLARAIGARTLATPPRPRTIFLEAAGALADNPRSCGI